MDNNHSANHRTSGKLILAGGALGVVFGDIGTSPLYTLKTILLLSGDSPTCFAFMVRNSTHITNYYRLPGDQVVEIGRRVAI